MSELQKQMDINLVTYAELIDGSLSTESLDLVKAVPEFFTSKLVAVANFFKKEKDTLEAATGRELSVYSKELVINRQNFSVGKKDIDYATVKRRIVPVTAGVKVNIMEMANLLEESNAIVNDHVENILKDTLEVIARLAADKEYRLSSRPVMLDQKYVKAATVLEKNIGKIIDARKVSDNAPVKDLVPSIPHLSEAIEIALKYSNNNNVEMYTKIKNDVDAIFSYTETLYKTFQDEKDVIKKTRIVEVANYIQTAANLVTQSINTLYLSTQSVMMINTLVKTMLDKK